MERETNNQVIKETVYRLNALQSMSWLTTELKTEKDYLVLVLRALTVAQTVGNVNESSILEQINKGD